MWSVFCVAYTQGGCCHITSVRKEQSVLSLITMQTISLTNSLKREYSIYIWCKWFHTNILTSLIGSVATYHILLTTYSLYKTMSTTMKYADLAIYTAWHLILRAKLAIRYLKKFIAPVKLTLLKNLPNMTSKFKFGFDLRH